MESWEWQEVRGIFWGLVGQAMDLGHFSSGGNSEPAERLKGLSDLGFKSSILGPICVRCLEGTVERSTLGSWILSAQTCSMQMGIMEVV